VDQVEASYRESPPSSRPPSDYILKYPCPQCKQEHWARYSHGHKEGYWFCYTDVKFIPAARVRAYWRRLNEEVKEGQVQKAKTR
jgi:hypothetical protein